MRNLLIALILITALTSCNQNDKTKTVSEAEITSEKIIEYGNTLQVFTSAHNSEFKLTPTGTIEFSDYKQPLETEASILVDPTKKLKGDIVKSLSVAIKSAEELYSIHPTNPLSSIQASLNLLLKESNNLPAIPLHSKVQ